MSAAQVSWRMEDVIGNKRSITGDCIGGNNNNNNSNRVKKRSRVLLEAGRPPLGRVSTLHKKNYPSNNNYDENNDNKTNELLCLTPLRIQGWKKVCELEKLDDRQLVGVVMEIERKYYKLIQFEREEIERARKLLGNNDGCRKNLHNSGWER